MPASGTLPGCGGVNPNGGDDLPDPVTIPSARVRPGQFVTIQHPAIKSGETVTVEFNAPDGFHYAFEAHNCGAGWVRVPVPPYANMQSGAVGEGTITVSLKDMNATGAWTIVELPNAPDMVPGQLLRMMYQAALDEHEALLPKLTQTENAVGGGLDASSAIAATNTEINLLKRLLAEYDATGTFTVNTPSGGQVTLSEEQLRIADRYVAAFVIETASELDRVAKSLSTSQTTQSDPITFPTAGEMQAQVEAGIQQIRDSLGVGFSASSAFAAAAGLFVAGIGLWVEAPIIIFAGALLTVGGAISSFGGGLVGNGNSDSFLNDVGDGFNSMQEAGSQLVRYFGGLLSSGFGALTNTWDFYNNAQNIRCTDPNQQRSQSQKLLQLDALTPAEQQFCDDTNAAPDYCVSDGDCPDETTCVIFVCVSPDDITTNGGDDTPIDDVNGGAAPLAGCWKTTSAVSQSDLADISATDSGIIYEFDDKGQLERYWVQFQPLGVSVVNVEEYIRFTFPNGGIWAEAVESADSTVAAIGSRMSVEFEYTAHTVEKNAEGCEVFDWMTRATTAHFDITLTGNPPSAFDGTFSTTAVSTVNNPNTGLSSSTTDTADGFIRGIRVSCPDPSSPTVNSQEEWCP